MGLLSLHLVLASLAIAACRSNAGSSQGFFTMKS
jgi:hypothetical protein